MVRQHYLSLARACLQAAADNPGDAWEGLPRALIMWMDMEPKTPRALFEHLRQTGIDVPDWLRGEPEMKHLDHVPSKGTRAVLVFKAFVAAIVGEKG